MEETSPEAGQKSLDAGHGNRFQSKLLMLYAIRAVNHKYQFYLGTELNVGEKFDDLIFHYKDDNDTTKSRRSVYLQAKHRINETGNRNLITGQQLTDENNGDFSLLKYLKSYVKITSKGNDIEHCIICTNVDFNLNDLQKNGITLESVDKTRWPTFLDCTEVKPQQTCYKLKVLDNLKNISKEIKRKWIIKCTREDLIDLFNTCKDDKITSLFVNCNEEVNGKQFNDYTALEIRNIFNDKSVQNFFKNCDDKIIAGVFEGFLSFSDDFLEKLVFAVKMPNEDELDDILTKEVGKYFQLSNAALQSAYVMNEMVNWFKRQDNLWLTPKDAEDIMNEKATELMILCQITLRSIDYQDKLKKVIEFNESVVEQWISTLNSFWNNSQENILHVNSETPKLTAVKVFSAIKKLTEFPNIDDYFVTSSKRLKEYKNELENSLKTEKCHNFILVVDEDTKNPLEDDSFYENCIPINGKKKIILISSRNFTKEDPVNDTITYGQLSDNTKKLIRKKNVAFQGTDLTVEDLIDESQREKLLDLQLIENLLHMADNEIISVPSFNISGFEKLKYIKRKLKFPLKDQLYNKLDEAMGNKVIKEMNKDQHQQTNKIKEEIDINSNGEIKWLIQNDKRKKEIREKFEVLLDESDYFDIPFFSDVNEEEIIDQSNKRTIITGVAGTGKSTILSHYYEEIKREKPDNLVIKISLMNYSKILTNKLKVIGNINDFLINNVMDQNSFARSLLKHRLETGDRIILMLDGFDEIDNECQNKVVQLVENLHESIPLYITARPHLANQLQFEMSQLAHSLVKFTEEDQINFLTSTWEDYLTKETITYQEETIKQFAKQLIDRISKTLKDKEKDFIGIPLQCRILAECFQSKIKDEIIQKPDADLSHLIGGQQFDLINLYKSLIDEKRRVFRQEKIEENSRKSHIVNESIEYIIKKTERHLRKLAVQTIVYDQKDVDILIPSAGFQSESERKTEEKQLNEFGIRFGLLNKKSADNRIHFLHRTYAEYLVADYIFNGFLLDEENHNKLLENESARKWIVEEMLMKDNYEGVRVFFDSMLKEILNDKEWKNKIQNNNLPGHLQQFVTLLHPEEDKIPTLREAYEGRNANIMLIIFDFLVVMFHETPSEIPSVIYNSIIYWPNFNILKQRTDVFDQLLNHFDNASDDRLKSNIIEQLCIALSRNEQQMEQQNVNRFLNFMNRHVNFFKNDFVLHKLVDFFIESKFDELRQQFFEILTSKYSDDFCLTDLMIEVIYEHLDRKDCQIIQIEKTLTTLRKFKKNDVAAELSRFVLIRKPQTFKEEENDNIRLSLEKMGMTGLHGAALKGDLSLIEKEIGFSLENPENYSEENRNYVLQLMANQKEFFPPFYVAAAYGHDDICRIIINFLPNINDEKGFLRQALEDALKYENALMIQAILKSVREIQCQYSLVQLLIQSGISDCKNNNKLVVETIASILVQDKENGYRDLNDLVFYNTTNLKISKHVDCDILRGMIGAAGGFDNWIKRLMNTCVSTAFKILSNGLLDKLYQLELIPRLVDILITNSPLNNKTRPSKATSNYLSDYIKVSAPWEMKKFMTSFSTCVGEEDLKRFWFSRDDNNFLILLQFLIRKGRKFLNDILSYLPENLKKEIEDLSKIEEPRLIDHLISSPEFLESLDEIEQLNAVEYYLENGNEEQLLKFSQVFKVNQLEKIFDIIGYWGKEKGNKIASLLKEKMDSQTVIKYNEFIDRSWTINKQE